MPTAAPLSFVRSLVAGLTAFLTLFAAQAILPMLAERYSIATSCFLGGLVGTALLGRVFDGWGWAACAGGILAAPLAASVLVRRLDARADGSGAAASVASSAYPALPAGNPHAD
jgi:hypothetical protein